MIVLYASVESLATRIHQMRESINYPERYDLDAVYCVSYRTNDKRVTSHLQELASSFRALSGGVCDEQGASNACVSHVHNHVPRDEHIIATNGWHGCIIGNLIFMIQLMRKGRRDRKLCIFEHEMNESGYVYDIRI